MTVKRAGARINATSCQDAFMHSACKTTQLFRFYLVSITNCKQIQNTTLINYYCNKFTHAHTHTHTQTHTHTHTHKLQIYKELPLNGNEPSQMAGFQCPRQVLWAMQSPGAWPGARRSIDCNANCGLIVCKFLGQAIYATAHHHCDLNATLQVPRCFH